MAVFGGAVGAVAQYSVQVSSTNDYQHMMVGFAPVSLPLDSRQYDKVGYYARACNGNVTSYHQPDATTAQPAPAWQGQLPQGGIVRCEHDLARGTVSFGWPGKAMVVAYTGVPAEPRLLPAFCLCYVGDCVQLV